MAFSVAGFDVAFLDVLCCYIVALSAVDCRKKSAGEPLP